MADDSIAINEELLPDTAARNAWIVHKRRREELMAEFGKPLAISDKRVVEAVLLAIGCPDLASVVIVFTYPSRRSAEGWAAANLTDYGHPSLGIVPHDERFAGITDLRPAMVRARKEANGHRNSSTEERPGGGETG